MIAVLQRVSAGSVTIEDRVTGTIETGLVILLGVAEDDADRDADWLAEKTAGLRVFQDENQKMNRSIQDVSGSALVISQFTLLADYRKGRRPSFIHAADPEKGNRLYEYFMQRLTALGIPVEKGEFGAMMTVDIRNEGPVTMVLNSEVKFPRKR
ncbi:MAG: D-tyrosyl-tRNA(Tyr) deacylase [Lentisphaeria bacterium]|nr:D-tyrosyl-tRNA(Tyr) deacylase [Candidatus Neomarinimicrobiota bacterium]MCF7842422.1 D-tyrosyl-tRNA(Tyr) deacylase [Lentisphaeria bacterium]